MLLALIESGLSRQDAYAIVQRNSMLAWKQRTPFRGLLDADPDVTSRLDAAALEKMAATSTAYSSASAAANLTIV